MAKKPAKQDNESAEALDIISDASADVPPEATEPPVPVPVKPVFYDVEIYADFRKHPYLLDTQDANRIIIDDNYIKQFLSDNPGCIFPFGSWISDGRFRVKALISIYKNIYIATPSFSTQEECSLTLVSHPNPESIAERWRAPFITFAEMRGPAPEDVHKEPTKKIQSSRRADYLLGDG